MHKAEALERELDDMERLGETVDDDIQAAKSDWERKKADDAVPGAGGKTQIRQQGPPPEAGNQ